VDIHAGYATLRHGAIIPRQQAQRFLNQVAVVQTTWSNQSADAYFTLWSNSYPYILSNPLSLPAEQNLPYHDMVKKKKKQQHHVHLPTPLTFN
jgi:hypothetical protein